MNHIIDFDANDEWVTNYPVIEIEQKKEEEIIIGTEESFDQISTSLVQFDQNKKLDSSTTTPPEMLEIRRIKKKIVKPKNNEPTPPNYPGETKNIPKNFSRALKAYIRNNYTSDVLQVPEVRILMKAENDKAGRDTLMKFMKGTIGRQIANNFFGNQHWAVQFIIENKVSVDQFFKFTNEWYSKSS